MYAQNILNRHNNKNNTSICSILLVFAIITGLFILGLGILRFYSFRLECQLGMINNRIVSCEKTISKYEQLVAALKSPSRIHNMAVSDLGMHGSSDVATITVASYPDMQRYQSDFTADSEKRRANGFAKMINFISSRASAND